MCRTFRCRWYFKKIIHILTDWSKIGKQNRIKHTKHVTDKIYMRCTWSIHILHVSMIILTTWDCKQKMPDDKLGCVQMTHVCYTPYFTASQGCINYTCVSRIIILSAQVTVGRWCDTWRVTEHHSRTFFSGPTPALSLKHPACLFFWWLCVREHQWRIFIPTPPRSHIIGQVRNWHKNVSQIFSRTIETPVLGILGCDYRQPPTGMPWQGKWTGGRFDTTNAREPRPLAMQGSPRRFPHLDQFFWESGMWWKSRLSRNSGRPLKFK